MHVQSFAFLSALALAVTAQPVHVVAEESNVQERATGCVPAVVFAVRGSDDQQTTLGYNPRYSDLPEGMTNAANAVINKNGGGSLRPLNYPAIAASQQNLDSGDYQRSVNQGISTLQQDIVNYVNQCPSGKVFVLGYSQGAQVTSSALAGAPNYPPLKAHGRRKLHVIKTMSSNSC